MSHFSQTLFSWLHPRNLLTLLVLPLKWLWLYRATASGKSRFTWLWRALIWSWRAALILLVLDLLYVALIWPDWKKLARNDVPKSKFIFAYEQRAAKNRSLPLLQWQRIPDAWIPAHVKRAAIVGEDARFYTHSGIDVDAVIDAFDKNITIKKWKYGASTISQQTVKNLFFTSERTFLRKWHELLLTLGMERKLSKDRIMEIYLNVAEFGEGIYGIEAAAQHYYGKTALSLSEREAAELVATLPAPKKDNPLTRTKKFTRKANAIYRWMQTGGIPEGMEDEGDTNSSPPASEKPDPTATLGYQNGHPAHHI
jgi:monofunctional biosynthetic peptidoglycan transglycosylase